MPVKKLVLASLPILALAAGVPSANASVNVSAAGPGAGLVGYANPDITLDRSLPVTPTFANLDPLAPHDVVSEATRIVNNVPKPLFRSENIVAGETSAITFLPNVAAGSYDYYCSVHADVMTGTAIVR
jgi:hypothetical protein